MLRAGGRLAARSPAWRGAGGRWLGEAAVDHQHTADAPSSFQQQVGDGPASSNLHRRVG